MDIFANFAKHRCCKGHSEMTRMVWVVLMTALMMVQLAQCTPSGTCVKTDSCSCKFNDGSVISLSTLANPVGDPPRFNFTIAETGSYLYAYNPCNSFTFGTCVGVAACQMSPNGKEIFDIGNQDSATFKEDGTAITYTAVTGSTLRTTTVHLKCDPSATDPQFIVEGEDPSGPNKYFLTIRSNCACANGCLGGGLSGGSVLCILFSVLVILYIVVGVLFLKFVRGAEGKELIPNYEFWKDLPLLIKDGVLFVAGGCKSDTNYEQI